MTQQLNRIGVPDYYRFPFDNPDGVIFDHLTGDPTPYHRLDENELVIFIKSHFKDWPSTILKIDQQIFLDDYLEEMPD